MGLNQRRAPVPEQRRRRPRGARLAAPASRILVALVLLGAIWLPTVALSAGTGPAVIAINIALTAASLLAVAGRRRQRQSRRFRHRGAPRGETDGLEPTGPLGRH
jgi:hypothetical protein